VKKRKSPHLYSLRPNQLISRQTIAFAPCQSAKNGILGQFDLFFIHPLTIFSKMFLAHCKPAAPRIEVEVMDG
jgi:hypothetical protein